MNNIRLPAYCLAGLISTLSSLAYAAADEVTITSQQVTDKIYMLQGQGGNIGVFTGSDGVFMIDDQYAPLSDKIKAKLKELSDQPVKFLINTHWHGDHTGGNENFGDEPTVIMAHHNVRKRMSSEQFMELFQRSVPAAKDDALPIVTFSKALEFHMDGETIRVKHLPHAHTDGDAVIHFQNANVIHTGDLFFGDKFPFIDTSSGGSIEGVLKGLDKILSMADDKTKIIPGHGQLTDKKGLQRYRDALQRFKEKVAAAMQQHNTMDAVVAAKPLKEFEADWGGGFIDADNMVKILYSSLKNPPKHRHHH